MSIVQELQRQAVDNKDIDNLLRKAYIVANKLKLKDFEKWIFSELNGYKDINEIPEYRKLTGELKAKNLYRGELIPVVIDNQIIYNKIVTRKLTQSILELEELLKSNGDVYCALSMEENKILSNMSGDYTEFIICINKIYIIQIVNEVKNRILSWSLELESKGILGKDISFSEEEKRIASESLVINNNITTSGNIAIQQNSNNSSQVQDNSNKNLDNRIFNELKDIANNIKNEDKDEILKAINELEESQNSDLYKDKYNKFIQSAANYMTIFAPLIPMLTQMLV
jgi:hypothetical protein|nr:MAG TPA: AbiTii [Caudoviricetes sp.]